MSMPDHRYTQNDPIYSDDPMEEELMIEWNSQFDYQRELHAEHYDFEAEREYDDEPPCILGSGWWSHIVCACRAEKFTGITAELPW